MVLTAMQGSGDCPLCVWEKAENETYTVSDSVSYILQGMYVLRKSACMYTVVCVFTSGCLLLDTIATSV